MEKKINFWKEGFETSSYKVLSLSLQDELELTILNDYFRKFIKVEETKSKEPGKEDTVVAYSVIDIDKFKIESRTDEFKDNLELAAELSSRVLGEEYTSQLSIWGFVFLIPGLYLDIILYKTSLKKK